MKRIAAMLLAAVLSCSLLIGCGQKETAGEGSAKDVLRVASQSDVKSLDPAQAIDVHSANIYNDIYETLLTLDENKKIVPKLAEYEQVDDVTYLFKLKQGVHFHNGEELKASDVVFTFRRGMETALLAFIYGTVDTVEAVDDYTVKVVLTAPSAPFLAAMTAVASSIVNEKAVTEAGDSYGMNPVGTGPYKFVSWEQGVAVTLERYEDYWGEKPVYRQVVVRPIPEATNRTIELESGNVDIALDIPVTDLSRVEAADNLKLLRQVSNSIRYLGFNCEAAPFDDVRVRQAFAYAIDVAALTKAVNGDTCEVANAPFSSNIMYYKEDANAHELDLEKAKSLLAEAGYGDGMEVTILTDERKEYMDIATIVQSQLKELNVDVKIEVLEWATYLSRVYAGECQMYIIGWACQTPDPDTVVYSTFHSSMKGNGGNMSFYDSPEADRLLELGRTTSDDAEREKIYYELQDLLINDRPWIYLWVTEVFVGTSDSVEYMELDPVGTHCYYKVR